MKLSPEVDPVPKAPDAPLLDFASRGFLMYPIEV
jgi:hypothetical protein